MTKNTSSIWVWDTDRDFVDRTRIAIEIDYRLSTLDEIVFWDADAPLVTNNKLIYKATEVAARGLASVAYYPPSHHNPVISTELRVAIETACDVNEVAFHPCEIRTKSGRVIDAWNLYPLSRVACVDREISDISWDRSKVDQSSWSINQARRVIFKDEFLGSKKISRIKEDISWTVVSDTLKRAIESINVKGISFRRDKDSRIGNLFGIE